MANRKQKELQLTLIVPTPASSTDRKQMHIRPIANAFAFGKLKKKMTEAALREEVEKLGAVVNTVVQGMSKTTVNLELSSIEVALAVSAEGSIGLATAGVEATFTAKFERKK